MISKRWAMSRNWILWLGVFVLTFGSTALLVGCASEEKSSEPEIMAVSEATVQETVQETIVTSVSAQKAYTLIQERSDDPNFKIIDVRTPDEYNSGRVEGAINIDFNSDTFKDTLLKLDKSVDYLVYCRSGNRSSGAVKVMEEMEFAVIYHMNGGIIEWSAEALPFDR